MALSGEGRLLSHLELVEVHDDLVSLVQSAVGVSVLVESTEGNSAVVSLRHHCESRGVLVMLNVASGSHNLRSLHESGSVGAGWGGEAVHVLSILDVSSTVE